MPSEKEGRLLYFVGQNGVDSLMAAISGMSARSDRKIRKQLLSQGVNLPPRNPNKAPVPAGQPTQETQQAKIIAFPERLSVPPSEPPDKAS